MKKNPLQNSKKIREFTNEEKITIFAMDVAGEEPEKIAKKLGCKTKYAIYQARKSRWYGLLAAAYNSGVFDRNKQPDEAAAG